jgi:hypothetical protein
MWVSNVMSVYCTEYSLKHRLPFMPSLFLKGGIHRTLLALLDRSVNLFVLQIQH